MASQSRRKVERLAAKFAKAQAARDAALHELQEGLREADATGEFTRKELIALSGLARQTVFDALKPKS
ncbi:hypothetical protein SAMN05660642_04643 [Geodermatophilus siccatus]|uniref:Uncharacterized protein n=1 Tax=Geodermatophilus siccatus TaxID=1137991 RepID=A0A1H0AQB3_9ACTN|nr:hypothetical protein [Geodermatophilus siccatus]SDN35293.1 hypothetical protein SAMN05660642_04643 [Geodermatophilus siccatus]